MKFSRLTIIALAALTLLPLMGLGCRGGDSAAKDRLGKPITLSWWRVTDSTDTFNEVITAYQSSHPNVNVRVRLIHPEEFEQVALEALAADTGPDIVSLPNTYVRAWRDRLAPLPPELELSFIEVTGLIKKEPVAVTRKVPSLNFRQFRDTFIDVVQEDAVIDGNIYALPLALDSMVMYYNRALLSAANLPNPPATWTEFKEAVQKLTKLDASGRPIRSGAAMGTDNVPYAADLVASLMLQNGTRMMDAGNTVALFNRPIEVGGQEYTPGADAVRFYTDFANPTKETYSWSPDEPPAWEAFASGRVAFTFGYWRDRAQLMKRAPQVDIGIANFPQIDGTERPSYFASYYLEAVTKKSAHRDEAWGLLQFVAKPEQVTGYLTATKKLTAHRAHVQAQLDDIELGVPAKQILTSRTWYRGLKPKVAEAALQALIRQVVAGGDISEALLFAARQVNQTLAPATR